MRLMMRCAPCLEQRDTAARTTIPRPSLLCASGLSPNCLFRLATLTGDAAFADQGGARIARLREWQSNEGWFWEYQGADPGYLTLTIAMLAEIDGFKPELGLRERIAAAVRFLHDIQPPDGWLGGEWTSRNTHNYFPHGFELCGAWLPEALHINSRAIAALRNGPEYADDHIIGHHCWSYLLAGMTWRDERPAAPMAAQGRRVYPEAGIIVERRGDRTLLLASRKGGAFRFYRESRLVHSDTGVSLVMKRGGKRRTAVCHLWADDIEVRLEDDRIEIAGGMQWAKHQRMTPFKNIVLRLLMLSIGRFKPDLVRRMLQTMLITGKSAAPFAFRRTLDWEPDAMAVADAIDGTEWTHVEAAGIGPAQASIYTVMSRVWHPSQLQGWTDLTDRIPHGGGRSLFVSRKI
jgi:hypothetical protein